MESATPKIVVIQKIAEKLVGSIANVNKLVDAKGNGIKLIMIFTIKGISSEALK